MDYPAASERRLKIGVLLDSLKVSRWVDKVLREIDESDFLVVDLILLNRRGTESEGLWLRLTRTLPKALFLLYERVDHSLFSRGAYDALSPVDRSQRIHSVKPIEVHPVRNGVGQEIKTKDVDAIRSLELDVLLNFSCETLTGPILSAARCGVWSLQHGDNRQYRGAAPLFWEIYEKNYFSGSTLQQVNGGPDAGRILYRSRAATHMYSLFRNRNPIYWKTAEFVIRRLRDLYQRGWQFIESRETYQEGSYKNTPVYKIPSNIQMCAFIGKVTYRYALNKVTYFLRRERWFLAFRQNAAGAEDFIEIKPSPGKFAADPFVVSGNGQDTVFFEELDFQTNKGIIAYSVIGKDGTPSKPEVALETDYHLSYPMIFSWKGARYMIPESRQSRTIELYQELSFPDRWGLAKVLFRDVDAVDATLYENEAGVWLFVNMATRGGSNRDELFLFHADDPMGEWVPHPLNPIVSDVGRSRPAGHLFWRDGVLIRPSQDNSVRYGYAVNFNRVDVLTPIDYRETLLDRLTPDMFPRCLGIHTYNAGGNLEVVDGLRMPSKWASRAARRQ